MSAALRLPLDPVRLAELTAPERGRIYRACNLHPVQIACSEEAVRRVLAQCYERGAR